MWWCLVGVASAADWLLLQGTEPGPDPAAIRPFGFVQVVGEGIVGGGPVEGLSEPSYAEFDGQVPNFDRIGAGDASFGLTVRRARAGLRGAAPKTDGRVAYLLSAEFGDNGMTRTSPVVLTDASVTFSYVPGARVRVGQFKLPLSEEALEMNPLAAEFVDTAQATGQLLGENPIVAGAYTGGASGFRDLGVQVFDEVALGHAGLAWAAMVSNGRMGGLELDDAKDLTARVSFWPVIWGERGDPAREELGVYGFVQTGQRTIDEARFPRTRFGAGVQLERSGWHARVEALGASGVVELGAVPPFPGQPVVVSPEGLAAGGSAFVHYEHGLLGGGLRWDETWTSLNEDRLRIYRNGTFDLQIEPTPRVRCMVDTELRWVAAPHGSPDEQTISAAMGEKVALQAAVVF